MKKIYGWCWAAVILAGCASGRVTTMQEAINDDSTKKTDWVDENERAIDALIANKGPDSPGFSKERPPIAVFDWDNTVILGSLTEALYIEMVEGMLFSFDAEFWKQIPDKERNDLKPDVNAVLPLSPDQRQKSADYGDYKKGMMKLWTQARDQKGDLVASRWMASLLTGLSIDDVKRFTSRALDRGLEFSMTRSNGLNRGLRFFPEMVELIERFQQEGFEVWVVTEVPQWVAEEAAARVDIPKENVIGTLPAWDSDGRIHSKVLRVPYRKGKVDAIQETIRRVPDFVAGGDNGDIEMLMLGQGPRLVLDHRKMPLMEIAQQRGWLIQTPFITVK